MVKACTVLGGLTDDKWSEKHDRVIQMFLANPETSLLLLYIDPPTQELCIISGIPPLQLDQTSYFVRTKSVPVTGSNFHSVLGMGTVHGNYVDALLRVMQGLYAPNFFENKTWPDSILYLYHIPYTLSHVHIQYLQLNMYFP